MPSRSTCGVTSPAPGATSASAISRTDWPRHPATRTLRGSRSSSTRSSSRPTRRSTSRAARRTTSAQHKGISADQAQEMLDRVTGIAADAGLAVPLRSAQAHQHREGARAAAFRQGAGPSARARRAPHVRVLHRGPPPRARGRARRAGGGRGLDAGCRARALQSGEHLPAVRADQAQATRVRHQRRAVLRHRREVRRLGRAAAEAFAQIVRQVWAEHREAVAAEV